MRRIKFTISYDGTEYHGWQVQPGLPTIQGTLETVLGEIEKAGVHVEGSGRTDAGVHALAQVAACSLANPIPVDNLRKAMNRLLPADIRIISVEEGADDFHPRFQAKAKTYEYRIWRDEVCPPFQRRYVYHFPYRINEDAFFAAAPLYAGTHDFTAFAAADEKDELRASKVRTVYSSEMLRQGAMLIYRVRGSGFLKHMVRNLTGTMIDMSRGNMSLDELRALLQPGAQRKACHSAPARGLFLVSVEYP
ncbi:MAG: tRNA pseudouridine(38-40) synthase TruA [Acidobacteria bacterium]|nr:tRNA pseudouridine(38-40) synthase TruA [Acidobacteriota bacterium]